MPADWPEIEELYHAARERPPADRDAFVREACRGDERLREEVLSLLAQETAAERLMEEPAAGAATQRLAVVPGTRLGPYEVVDLLGAGGMGEVYRARDTRLGRDVAVKVLPAAFAAERERLRLFEREARATAALNHGNILAVHDIGSHEGSPYIVEELLEGETVRARLRNGALPCRNAVDIATQVARGLASAHARGILHRDLKPENVFLTNDGGVKILDFGLAKLAPASGLDGSTLTQSAPGMAMGTAAYMSPEQARGETVDARSDLFALGAMLHEMLSGHSPFRRATLAETLGAVLHEDPPPLASPARDCPPPLAQVVRRCLEKRPEDRFSTAHDLALALEASSWSQPQVSGAAPTASGRPWRRRLFALGALTLLLVAGALGLWLALHGRSTGAPSLDPDRVVVARFENRTGDPSLDAVGTLAASRIAAGLETTRAIAVAPVSSAREDGGRRRVDDVAREAGAGLVVSGEYYLEGERLRFESRLLYATGETTARPLDSATAPRGEPLPAIEAIAQQAMGAFALRALDETLDARHLSRIPTYAAATECIAAHELFYEVYGTSYERSLPRYAHALELDPDFFFPRLQLILAYWSRGDVASGEREIGAAEAGREKLTALERRRLDEAVAMIRGHEEEAHTALLAALRLEPRSLWLRIQLAYTAVWTNRPAEAVAVLSERLPWERILNPNNPFYTTYFHNMTGALHLLGQHERELAEARRAVGLYPDLLAPRFFEVRALAGLGRAAEAEALVSGSLGVTSRIGIAEEVALVAAAELRRHGRREESIAVAERTVAWLRGRGPDRTRTDADRLFLARHLCLAERFAEARELAAALAAEQPADVDHVGLLGVLAARLGDRDGADRLDRRLAAVGGGGQRSLWWRARIAAVLGERPRALERLREALAAGGAVELAEGAGIYVALHREMDLETLLGDPAFEQLVAPRG